MKDFDEWQVLDTWSGSRDQTYYLVSNGDRYTILVTEESDAKTPVWDAGSANADGEFDFLDVQAIALHFGRKAELEELRKARSSARFAGARGVSRR